MTAKDYVESDQLDLEHLSMTQSNIENLDLDNLIEEISDMGKSQRQSLKSYLTRLLEHLLKLVTGNRN